MSRKNLKIMTNSELAIEIETTAKYLASSVASRKSFYASQAEMVELEYNIDLLADAADDAKKEQQIRANKFTYKETLKNKPENKAKSQSDLRAVLPAYALEAMIAAKAYPFDESEILSEETKKEECKINIEITLAIMQAAQTVQTMDMDYWPQDQSLGLPEGVSLYNYDDGVWLVNDNDSCNMDDATKIVCVLPAPLKAMEKYNYEGRTINVYRACKYQNKWAVLDTKTKVYYFIGTGMQFCMVKAKELNSNV
jgi:hypothetical protein